VKNPGHRGVGGQGAAWKCRSDRSHNIHSATRCATPSVILASRPHVYAAEIGAALGGRKSGRGWSACCPAHDDSTPSLSIQDADDGRVLVHCHAGCEQAEVITALKARGLWPKNSGYFQRPTIECKSEHDDAERTNAALAILHAAGPASGTPVESYLTARDQDFGARLAAFSCRPEASLGKNLAGDGGARHQRRAGNADGDPSHLPCR